MEILDHFQNLLSDVFRARTALNLVAAGLGGHSLVTLLGDTQFNTFALWQGDVSLGAFADGEDIGQTGGEHVTVGIFHVNDFEGSWMFLAVDDSADATQISSAGDHHQVSCEFKFKLKSSRGENVYAISLPDSKRMLSVIFPVAMSTWMVSLTLSVGSG